MKLICTLLSSAVTLSALVVLPVTTHAQTVPVKFSSQTCGLVGDGSDETVALAACISRAGPNAELVFAQPVSAYHFSSTISKPLPAGTIINFNNAPMVFDGQTPSTSGALSAIHFSGSNLQILSPNLTCSAICKTFEYNGLMINAGHNLVVSDANISGFRWAGLSIYDAIAGTSYNVTVNRGQFQLNRFGISTNASDITFNQSQMIYDWGATQEAINNGGVWDGMVGTASISGTRMTVSAVSTAQGGRPLHAGNGASHATQLSGPYIPDGTYIVSQNSGVTGGAGTYTISRSITKPAGPIWGSAYYDGMIPGGTNIALYGVTANGNGQSGIYAGVVNHLNIYGGNFIGNYNKGVDIGPASLYATDVNVFNATVTGNKTGNISFYHVTGGSIKYNTVSDTGGSFAIALQQGTTGVTVSWNSVNAVAGGFKVFIQTVATPVASGNFITNNIDLGGAGKWSAAGANSMYGN